MGDPAKTAFIMAAIYLAVAVAHAQTTEEAIPVASAEPETTLPVGDAEASRTQLDTVIVTARRKEERLQDVPLSIEVLDGDALAAAGLTLATDLQERVPGLVVSVPNARLTSYTIRGLGSSSANDGIESSVGLFLDGVYLGRQGLSIFDLVDLDRVEILRGPQGTLFGKNTTAGAINIVTQPPSDSYEANIEGTAANLGSRQLRGSVTGPLMDGTLAGRLTGYFTRRDGTVKNIYDGSDLNARNRYGLRGQLLWTPEARLSGRFIAEFGRTREACCVYPLVGPVRPAVAERDAYMEYQRPSVSAYDRVTDSDGRTHTDMRQEALSSEINWELAENHKIVSISAARKWHFLPLNDDATSLKLAETSTLNEHRQFSQEFRLDSSFDHFDSTAGLFYLRQDFLGRESVTLGEDIGGWVFGGLIRQNALPFATMSNSGPALYLLIPPETLDGTKIVTPYTQQSDSMAGFGSINWHLSERFELTTGLRYTYEWKTAEVSRSRTGGNPNASPLSLTNNLTPLGNLIGIDLSGYTFGGLLDDVAGGDFHRSNHRSEGNYSGQIALTYKLDADVNMYGSIARGYKSGGINLGVTGDSVKPTFEPEQATAYEAGVKGQFLERRIAMALAVYYTDIRDYQALTFDDENTLLPNPRQTNLLNVGHVKLQGVELDAYGYALAGLKLRAGVAYSDAVTTDFKQAPNEDRQTGLGSSGNDTLFKDQSGQTLYNAPRWSGTAGAEYGYFFNSGRIAYGSLDYSFRTEYYGTVERGRASRIEGYSITNARLGLRDGSDAWDVSVWSRNIFDKDYIATVYPLYGVGDYGAFAGDQRTFGLTVRANF